MKITRWNPHREWVTPFDRMYNGSLIRNHPRWHESNHWNLALDVAENENGFLVKASIPGIDPEDLEITFSDSVFTFKGELQEEDNFEKDKYYLRERKHGSFMRSISLPSTIDGDNIEAQYRSGVLELHLPKREEARPKKIKIQGNGSSKVIEGKIKDKPDKK